MNGIQGTLFREPNAPAGTPPLVLFFTEEAVKNERASRDGPPVFDRVIFIKVVVAGQRDEGPIYEIQRTVEGGAVKIDQNVYKRFGKPFEEWKLGQTPSNTGTPLEQWPLMDVAMVAALKAVHVYTVQQLAELSDAGLDQSFRRGGREWRAKALSWLDSARNAAGDAEARATIAKQQSQIDELRAQLQDLVSAKSSPTLGYDKPKRGRPRKIVEDEDIQVAAQDDQESRL